MIKTKRMLSLFLALVTVISVMSVASIPAQAATTIKSIKGSFDCYDYWESSSFSVSKKTRVKFTFNSEILTDVKIYYLDDECYDDVYLINKRTKSFSQTFTLKSNKTFYIDMDADVDYDDENSYDYSLLIQNVTVNSTGVKLRKSGTTCGVGKTIQLNPIFTPENSIPKSVTYSSSNSNVASVNKSGLITAKNLGKCTITVKLNNGKKATYSVTVNSKKLYVFKGSTRTAPKINGKTNTKWKSSKKSIATVSGQKFKGVKQGATSITTTVNKTKYTCYFYVVDYNTLYKNGVAILKDSLIDPRSFTVYHEYRGYDKDGNPCIVLDFGAKNSYGGMVRGYCNIWAYYNPKTKQFEYYDYCTDYKISLTAEKKLK